MVVMVQKEVGEAIVARPGRMSMLGLTIQFYGKPSLVCRVPARSFYPPPKVESVVLHILPWQEPPVQVSQGSLLRSGQGRLRRAAQTTA